MNGRAHQVKQRIDNLLQNAPGATPDMQLQGHWARYLCVLVSGFIEVAVREILGEYAKDKSAPSVGNYVEHSLAQVRNLKVGAILDLLGTFNPAWRSTLDQRIDEKHRHAIDSIVTNRHQIAHGQDSGITLHRLTEWYARAVSVIDLIEAQCA